MLGTLLFLGKLFSVLFTIFVLPLLVIWLVVRLARQNKDHGTIVGTTEAVQQMSRDLERMEQRIEALEQILMDLDRKTD